MIKLFFSILLGSLILIGSLQVINRDRYAFSFDVSRDKANTLSEDSLKIIDVYIKSSRKVFFKAYLRSPEMHTLVKELVCFYTERGLNADLDIVDPDIKFLEAKSDEISDPNTLVVKVGDRSQKTELFNEEEITKILNALQQPHENKIIILNQKADSPDIPEENLRLFTDFLTGYGYEWRVGLAKEAASKDLVVLANPMSDIKTHEVEEFKQALFRGASFLILVDSAHQTKNLNQFLKLIGVKLENDLVILHPDDPLTKQLSQNVAYLDHWVVDPDFSFFKGLSVLMFPDSRSVSIMQIQDKYSFSPLATVSSKEDSLLVQDINQMEDLKSVTSDQILKGSAPVFYIGEVSEGKNKLAKLALVGSSYPIQNRGMAIPANQKLIRKSISYLLGEEDIVVSRPESIEPPIQAIDSNVKFYGLLMLCFGYPFLMGFVVFLLRRTRLARANRAAP